MKAPEWSAKNPTRPTAWPASAAVDREGPAVLAREPESRIKVQNARMVVSIQ